VAQLKLTWEEFQTLALRKMIDLYPQIKEDIEVEHLIFLKEDHDGERSLAEMPDWVYIPTKLLKE